MWPVATATVASRSRSDVREQAVDRRQALGVDLLGQRARSGALGDHRGEVVRLRRRLEHQLAADREPDAADAAGSTSARVFR